MCTRGVRVPAASSSTSCESSGSVIEAVRFASFGTPSGDCTSGFTHNATCDDVNTTATMAIVENACVGKVSCSLQADDVTFGDGCQGVVKALAVEVACSA